MNRKMIIGIMGLVLVVVAAGLTYLLISISVEEQPATADTQTVDQGVQALISSGSNEELSTIVENIESDQGNEDAPEYLYLRAKYYADKNDTESMEPLVEKFKVAGPQEYTGEMQSMRHEDLVRDLENELKNAKVRKQISEQQVKAPL